MSFKLKDVSIEQGHGEKKNCLLGELIQSVSDTYQFTDQPVCFLNTSDVFNGKVINHNFSSPKGLPGQAKKSIRKHDLLFSEIRPANRRFALIDFDASNYVVSTKLMVLRCGPEITPSYLRYFLTSNEVLGHLQMLAESRSGTFPQITFDQIFSLEINLPPIQKQRAITKVLSDFDTKIELNQQMNKMLGAIAQALFKEWFVDFKFPGHEKVKFIDGLPEGWKTAPLGDYATMRNGFAFKSADFLKSGIPVIKIKNVKAGRMVFDDLAFVSQSIYDQNKKHSISLGDILITMSGNRIDGSPETWVGKVAMFSRSDKYLLNQRVSIIEVDSKAEHLRYYLSSLLSGEYYQTHFINHATSSGGQANISPDLVKRTSVTIPDEKVLKEFNKIADTIFQKSCKNDVENERLSDIRDSLLPRLMAGEVAA